MEYPLWGERLITYSPLAASALMRLMLLGCRWGIEGLGTYLATRPRGSRVLLGYNEVREGV